MKLDYKDLYTASAKKTSPRVRNPSRHWLKSWRLHTFALIAAGCCCVMFLVESEDTQAFIEQNLSATQLRFDLPLPGAATEQADAGGQTQPGGTHQSSAWETTIVKPGDSLAAIAHRHGIHPSQIHHLMESGGEIKALRHIRPGEELRYIKGEAGELLGLEYDISEIKRLSVEQVQPFQFGVAILERPYEVRQNRKAAIIQSTLYGTAKQAGLSDQLIMELASIYSYDIDFALDVRQGDRFTIIWNEYYRDGEKVKDGHIIATEFVNNNRSIRAVRYTDEAGNTGYFTPEGKNLRKAFLRSPVHFTRISSKFNPRRLHPIYKTRRPHRGVDYAAKTGTPVYAAGDGKVIFKGRKGGYGNAVIIRHGQRYTTLYAHLSRFGRKIRNGTRVKQGQTIGYVGSTG